MLKFITLILFAILSFPLIGQDNISVIDNDKQNSYWLNSTPIYKFPDFVKGKYYNGVVEIKVPRDTITTINGSVKKVAVKSLKILNINNVPEGLYCIPTISNNSEEHFFRVLFNVYGNSENISSTMIGVNFGVKYSVGDGKILVKQYKVSNLYLHSDTKRILETKNPEKDIYSLRSSWHDKAQKTEVSFWSSQMQIVDVELKDVLGNVKYSKTFTAKKGSNKLKIDQSFMPNGLYLYSVKSGESVLTKRLIVK
ncbi:MAG: T9SS type A sorting domain-containing protein [Ichthyobacteriaceae bacterium]|nr:T9SS type A sorting domain-containing protein [Ichthyobacteriaceae bacterium]